VVVTEVMVLERQEMMDHQDNPRAVVEAVPLLVRSAVMRVVQVLLARYS
jgi:hypothetical protein